MRDGHDDTASLILAAKVMTMHHDLIMQPRYTSKMAQYNRECANCFYPIAMVARLTLFPVVGLRMPPGFPKLLSGQSPTYAIRRWTPHAAPMATTLHTARVRSFGGKHVAVHDMLRDCTSAFPTFHFDDDGGDYDDAANLSPAVLVMATRHDLMHPVYTSKMGTRKSCNRLSMELLLSDCYGGTVGFVFTFLDFPCDWHCWLCLQRRASWWYCEFYPAAIVMTMHHDLIMQPRYTSKMAQQNRPCANLETDCQANCFYPIAMVARLALFPVVGLRMRPGFPKLHSGRSPMEAVPYDYYGTLQNRRFLLVAAFGTV